MTAMSRPLVTGSVVGGRHGWAFGRMLGEPATYGLVEEEFFIEGIASRYAVAPGTQLGWDGRWQVEPVGTASYRTRLLVLRPADSAGFNGTAVLCWNNVSAGYDAFGGADSVEVLEGGYALVAITAQRVGVHGIPPNPQGLIAWDEDRYGSLCIPSDDYSFDILTHVARAVRPEPATVSVDPMGGFEVQHVIAEGSSQSAGRLATYANAIQPLAKVIDGFILSLYFGTAAPLEVGDTVIAVPSPGSEETTRRPPLVGSHTLRDDLDVPIMVVNSESEALAYHGVRQPDTDRFRYWESAGTSHISLQVMRSVAARTERDFEMPVLAVDEEINPVSNAPVDDAALHYMRTWVESGTPPPVQPRIEISGDPPHIVRDAHGIARGGIRLPQVEVPLAHSSAIPRTPDIWGLLRGSYTPFSNEKLRTLYEDSATYLARFERATRSAEKAGVILPRDADALMAHASTNLPFPESTT